ncbi:Hypothetical predicted protein, partial [Paramuricea clavata]
NGSNLTVQEGIPVVLTIEVTGPLTTEISATATVLFASASDADFNALPLPGLNFSPGNTDETITIATTDDSIIEPDEVFVVTLSTTSLNVQIDKVKGVIIITINDNDEVPESASSLNNNTYVVIGAVVSAVVVLVMVVLIVACFLYRRMPKRVNEQDSADNIQNPAYRDTQPDGSPDEYAQQSSFIGGPIDANCQCLKTSDQVQPDRSHNYENVRRYALLNTRNNSGNEVFEENVYEVMH